MTFSNPARRATLIRTGNSDLIPDSKMKPFLPLIVSLALPLAALATDHWDAPHAGNPFLPGYYADASVVQDGGKSIVYATIDPWGGRTLGCWESEDFKQWTFRELNWPTKEACTSPTSGESMVWAPSVVRAPNGKFFMYVSVGSEVWVGTADQPLGPWHDANGGHPLIPGNFRPGFHMIDAEGFVDDDGSAYLYWGSGWDWKNGHCFAVKLKADMVSFDGEPRDVTPAGHYFEGPFMVKHGGRYFLMYSDGITIKDTYCVHYSVGATPFGPFEEAPNSPILSTDRERNIVSPGHHAVFRRGGRFYITYHRHSVPYVPDQAYRQMCVDELSFTGDGLIARVTPTHAGPDLVRGRPAGGLPAIATASSQLDELHGPARVLDDNYATRWSAAPDAHGAWLQLDLGSAVRIASSELRFEYAWKNYRFALEASSDGQAWTMLADHRTDGVTGSPVAINAPARCRYLRLTFPADDRGVTPSLFEWLVR
jgi:hypothetical protein